MITHLDVYGHVTVAGKHESMTARCGCGWSFTMRLTGQPSDTVTLATQAIEHETLAVFDVFELTTMPDELKATACTSVLRLADDETLRVAVIGSLDPSEANAMVVWGEQALTREFWRGHPRAEDIEHCVGMLVASALARLQLDAS